MTVSKFKNHIVIGYKPVLEIHSVTKKYMHTKEIEPQSRNSARM